MAAFQYLNHFPGSGKGYVHKAFDKGGAKAALREGEKRGLGLATVRNWISEWRKPASAAATKKAVKKVAPKKTKAAPAKKSVKKAVKKAPAAKKAKAVKKAPAAKAPRARAPKADVVLDG